MADSREPQQAQQPQPFEPGLRALLRWTAAMYVVISPLMQYMVMRLAGASVPPGVFLALTLAVPLLLLFYAWLPWWERAMGRAYLPAAVALIMVNVTLPRLVLMGGPEVADVHAPVTLFSMLRVWTTLGVVMIMLAWQYRLRTAVVTAVALSVLDGLLSAPFADRADALLFAAIWIARTASLILLAAAVHWAVQAQRRQRDSLQEANHQLALYLAAAEQLAVSEERNRLAREMHDTLAHSLSAVALELEAVQALWENDPPAARGMLEHAARSTRAGLREARRAMQALRAGPLEELGLLGALSELAHAAAARQGLELSLCLPECAGLPPDAEQCLYRVAQESLTNVVRHAGASALRVALECGEAAVLTVADDGRGFAAHGDGSLPAGPGLGLRGLRERVAHVGGVLTVESAPAAGTTVRCALPLHAGGAAP